MELQMFWLVCGHLLILLRYTAAQCNVATTTLDTSSDATSIASCATYTGTVVLAANSALETASLEGVETLDGDLILANSSSLSTIVSSTLRLITGSCVLSNLPFISNITLPLWSSVNSLTLESIPQPAVLNMLTTQQQVTNVRVVNTSLEGLFGLSLRNAQMDTLEIADNRYLQNLQFGVGNISQSAAFINNGGGPVSLPNLTNSYMLTISNSSALNVPLLTVVNGDLVLDGNSATNLSLPELSFIGGDLKLVNNGQLMSVDFPGLNNVGKNLTVQANDNLQDLDGFPNLNLISGGLTIEGRSVNSASFPSLLNIFGEIEIQAEDNKEVCSGIPAQQAKSSPSCASGGHRGLSNGAIAGIVVGVVVPSIALIAVAAVWFHRRKKRQSQSVAAHEIGGSEIQQLPSGDGTYAKQLPSSPDLREGYSMLAASPQEMATHASLHELPNKEQKREFAELG